MGGLLHVTGSRSEPVRAGVSLGDHRGDLRLIGALMAMHHVTNNDGRGQFVDVALYEAVFGVRETCSGFFRASVIARRTGQLPRIAPSNSRRART